MRNSSGFALTPGKGVATYEIGTFCVRVVQSIEEIRSGGGKEVADVLLKGVDLFTGRVLGDKAIVVDGVDVAFLTDHVSEASGFKEGRGRRREKEG